MSPNSVARGDQSLAGLRAVLGVATGLILATAFLGNAFIAPQGGTPHIAATVSEKLLLAVFIGSAFVAWGAALAHAWRALKREPGKRVVVMGLLIIGNFVGAMIYFAVYAAWQRT
jgi:hypothetical protein